jgi:hypothetical protein
MISLERRIALLLGIIFFVSYAYFFQGGGWNPNSRLKRFCPIRHFGVHHLRNKISSCTTPSRNASNPSLSAAASARTRHVAKAAIALSYTFASFFSVHSRLSTSWCNTSRRDKSIIALARFRRNIASCYHTQHRFRCAVCLGLW